MNIKPIRTSVDHAAALKEVERLWDKAQPGSPAGDKFEVLSALCSPRTSRTLQLEGPWALTL
jgi:antitoxin component HigA of HigAB toxin-antitoxin module